MSEPTSFCPALSCASCDAWLGLARMRVLAVTDDESVLVVDVESVDEVAGCPGCGVVASVHAREPVTVIDAPSFGRAVRLVWRKCRYACHEFACGVGTFVEQDDRVAAPRALLSARAVNWALAQLRAEHASISGLARQLGVDWNTMWRALKARLESLDADPRRFDGVRMLGVDEHVWHHVDQRVRGPVDAHRDGRSEP